MSIEAEDAAREAKLSGFLCFVDIAIKHGREVGLTDDYIIQGVRNRLIRSEGCTELTMPEATNIIARARKELGLRVKNLTEFRAARRRLGLVGADDATPSDHADAVTNWALVTKNFYRRLREGRIPKAEVEAALPEGSGGWRELIKKWGASPAPDEGQERGERVTPRETPGERVMQAARAAGRPVRTATDYRLAKAEFEKDGAA